MHEPIAKVPKATAGKNNNTQERNRNAWRLGSITERVRNSNVRNVKGKMKRQDVLLHRNEHDKETGKGLCEA